MCQRWKGWWPTISRISCRYITVLWPLVEFWLTWALQCTLLVFEGLLPDPHNTAVLDLLFLLCHWHRLAKLQMHTDETLEIMDNVTKSLGNTICAFEANACLVFRTRELKCKVQGHQFHKVHSQSQHEGTSTSVAVSTQRPKTLNLRTYKLHALGDYMASIRMFGTTDSYLTQPVSIW